MHLYFSPADDVLLRITANADKGHFHICWQNLRLSYEALQYLLMKPRQQMIRHADNNSICRWNGCCLGALREAKLRCHGRYAISTACMFIARHADLYEVICNWIMNIIIIIIIQACIMQYGMMNCFCPANVSAWRFSNVVLIVKCVVHIKSNWLLWLYCNIFNFFCILSLD